MTWAKICARCYGDGPLFPAPCAERPERFRGLPLGMYHCPDCGAMLLAGVPHADVCKECRDKKHPLFDEGIV
jgi:hypothetical protein